MLLGGMERIQNGVNSGLFPLTGNCVFDLSHHTHLVVACEVSLLPAGEGSSARTASAEI